MSLDPQISQLNRFRFFDRELPGKFVVHTDPVQVRIQPYRNSKRCSFYSQLRFWSTMCFQQLNERELRIVPYSLSFQHTAKTSENEDVLQSYYSNFLYAALHIAVSIPKLQDIKKLSQYFFLPEALLLEHLNSLQRMGLVENKGSDKWIWKSGDLHLPKNSPWIQSHHSNWRMQSLTDLTYKKPQSLHYSLVQSISVTDLQNLRFQVVRWIEDFQKVANPSKPEELVCLNLDFFTLSKT